MTRFSLLSSTIHFFPLVQLIYIYIYIKEKKKHLSTQRKNIFYPKEKNQWAVEA